ncbi:TlpA family protein disulfide reductase [Bradymonadaceae bacterium TMQ3]|uniref:TlpA family protein disulfide reductase n=1 Tax=Lujinxingia sediminis TaxID=2480984 RepID=A0ABY0CVK5_9DELT|nr:TlpA disulfide reductase family protein [Lujinxingia sediminis]RDV40051.1 TlpA family protein disulfide reductase [Bradymonadaceae bacterium TMQ3]RVU47902.1 TlpA family protein disulfide reductase [Lujinxingia sediminis]TXC77204.1 TlpA family protein disulfide reductase [Bradymonadales bacterium TMQ1]
MSQPTPGMPPGSLEDAPSVDTTPSGAPPVDKKNMALSTLIGLVVGVLLVVNAWNLWGPTAGLRSGQPAPDLALPMLGTGEVVDLQDYRGQVVLIDFWATWCPPCREQMPTLQRLADDPEFEAAVLSVNTDDPTADREALVETYLDYNGLTLPTLLDEGPVRARFKVRAVPTLVVVDAQGRVVTSSSGLHSEADLRAFAAEAAAQ